MLVTKAEVVDKAEIYNLWKENFAFDDDGYTDFYFNDGYEKADNYLLKHDEKIVSCLQVLHHQMSFNDDIVDYAFIVGVITAKQYRRQGYMKTLLSEVLSLIEGPLTLIQGYKPEIYYPFGFKPQYRQRKVVIKPSPQQFSGYDTNIDFGVSEMTELYRLFISQRNGAKVRDENDFVRLLNLLKAMGRKVLFLALAGELKAYMIYDDRQGIKVEELIYQSEAEARILLAHFVAEVELIINAGEECLCEQIIAEKGEFLTLVRCEDPLLEEKYFKDEKRRLYFNEYE